MDRALLVGINRYPYPNALNGCVNDINDIEAELLNALGFAPENIVTLLDADATADAIRSALKDAVSKLTKGDRFLFWYSGHGAQLVDGDVATDVICPVNFDFTPETSVTVSDFHNVFSQIPTSVTADWGSDSCHSGDLERDFYRKGVPKVFRRNPATVHVATAPTKFARFKDVSATLPNIALISGCRSDQTSADAFIDGRYNGAFSYYFIQTLRSPAGLKTSLTELVPEVQAALHNAGYDQIPQLSGPPSQVDRAFL
ncbi:MAG TPA: caspase family protein [Geobacteraceae bacterium]